MNLNTGHGHVFPRPDGMKARCGGPAICKECAIDAARHAPKPEESDGFKLQLMGTDGARWAAEFNKVAVRLGYSKMDEGWLIGWFANAIEAGRNAPESRDE